MTDSVSAGPAEVRVDVVVAGGGLAGLSTAMFLARRGIRVLVAEKHPGTSIHPRAAGQNPRTMELLRIGGIAEEVRRVSDIRGSQGVFTIKIAESVRGRVFDTFAESFEDLVAATAQCAPVPWALVAQDRLEPIMLAQARRFGATVRFGTEVVSFEQDGEGVTVRLRERAGGGGTVVRADYLVAADGDRSPIRERLAVPRHGYGTLAHVMGMIFEADLSGVLPPGASGLYYLRHPKFTGAFGVTDRPERHTFWAEYDPARGESPADFTPERWVELIRLGLDAPDLRPRLLEALPWEMAARIAHRWRQGRVFLVGDAAKVNPPTGGLGGNTAIGDGFDLAWKLAAVLHGEAGPGLLDSYERERRLVAELVVDESLYLYAHRLAPHMAGVVPAETGYAQVILGFRYRSDAVIIDDADPARAEDPARASGRPGFRAPHLWVERQGERCSTIDLFGRGWVVLCGPQGGGWAAA
ncbi:aklavinone 12-hydroxylase RdmE, partial [Marinitenerispora sediminis]